MYHIVRTQSLGDWTEFPLESESDEDLMEFCVERFGGYMLDAQFVDWDVAIARLAEKGSFVGSDLRICAVILNYAFSIYELER